MNGKQCPACGASIGANERECKYCGESIAVQPQPQQQYQEPVRQEYRAPQQQQQFQGQSQQSDSRYNYLKAYYQNEFRRIDEGRGSYQGKWNWAAFLFSWIWAFTKGLWGIGLAGMFISIIISGMGFGFLNIVLWILFGLKGNYIYHNLIKTGNQFPVMR